MQLSKSKVCAFLLFCCYLVYFFIDASTKSGVSIIYGFLGLVVIWIGQGMGPVRLRKHWIPVWLELFGWLILLRPIIYFLFFD